MVQTSARLLRLLSLLHSRRFWSGAALADALGVTERSVRRDVERLRSLGYPVHAAGGVGGGYELGAGKALPPLPLEDDEAVAVAVGLRAAAAGPITGVEEASIRALTKLEQVLPKRLRRRLEALQAVSVRLWDTTPRVDAEVLSVLANASRDHLTVTFDYGNRDGEQTARRVEPYRLVHTSMRWYLLAYDLGRRDWRTFRVDRIAGRPLSGAAFSPRALPSEDVAAWVSQRISSDLYRYRAQVVFHAPASEVSARLSGIAGRIESLSGRRCRVHTGADDLESLAFFLGRLGFDFEVESPDALREFMRAMAGRLARAAGKPDEAPRGAGRSRRGR